MLFCTINEKHNKILGTKVFAQLDFSTFSEDLT